MIFLIIFKKLILKYNISLKPISPISIFIFRKQKKIKIQLNYLFKPKKLRKKQIHSLFIKLE
jgi:hypothetical protein